MKETVGVCVWGGGGRGIWVLQSYNFMCSRKKLISVKISFVLFFKMGGTSGGANDIKGKGGGGRPGGMIRISVL